MTLARLLQALNRPELSPRYAEQDTTHLEREVTGIAYDSRQVAPGEVFVALKGQHADGVVFARQALSRGASAIVSETARPGDLPAPWITVSDARQALAVIAAEFYRHPSREMVAIGITGTNGKTTTAYLISSILDAAGLRPGLLGTVAYRIGDEERAATRTTPEAPDLQRLFREMIDRGCGACVMEVSSHALALRRIDETRFAAAVFTNLTRDHLDFHADMGSYFEAKRRLFEMLPPEAPAILNIDDPRGADLVDVVSRPVTYAISRAAAVTPGPLSFSLDGLEFEVRTPRGLVTVRSRLVGRPNVYNILAAVAATMALGLPFSTIEAGIAGLEGVSGRFQVVSNLVDDVTVVVDYAHTDDALRNLLDTARPLAPGRLVTVFGCGGDRDRTKRPLMGAVAARLSDLVIITSDNPRSEDPSRIIDEVKRGLVPAPGRVNGSENAARNGRRPAAGGPPYLAIVDRREAIGRAIELGRPGDLILIAGKGHEKYQVIGDQVLPFDDVAVAREALAKRRAKSRVG